jgi:hypothetical protein
MSLQQVHLKEVIDKIRICNPDFADCLEKQVIAVENSGGSLPKLFMAEYSYGESIIDASGFSLPRNSDERVQKELLSSLSDKKRVPLILILTNSAEVYVGVKSLKLLRAGELLGTYESVGFMQKQFSQFRSLSHTSSWQSSAGSRSIFFPVLFRSEKASDKFISLLERKKALMSSDLSEYIFSANGTIRDKIRNDFFPMVKALVNIPELESNWRTKVLVFADEWISTGINESSLFHKCIYDAALDQASFSINRDAIISQALSRLPTHLSVSDIAKTILLDLVQICLDDTFAYEVLRNDDPQVTGPYRLFQDFLQRELGYSDPPVIIHPSDSRGRMQTSEKVISYYSATATGQILSSDNWDLSKVFFNTMRQIIMREEIVSFLSELSGYQIRLSCYGRRRKVLDAVDNREIFNDLLGQVRMEQNVDFDHPFLRACIKIEFTKKM